MSYFSIFLFICITLWNSRENFWRDPPPGPPLFWKIRPPPAEKKIGPPPLGFWSSHTYVPKPKVTYHLESAWTIVRVRFCLISFSAFEKNIPRLYSPTVDEHLPLLLTLEDGKVKKRNCHRENIFPPARPLLRLQKCKKNTESENQKGHPCVFWWINFMP